MDELYTTELVGLGVTLTELAVKGTATAISTKIKSIKEEKDVNKVKTRYEEIINELLSEREEAVRIAQTYKAELEKVVISDEDIQHLHNTVARLIELVKQTQLANDDSNSTVNSQIPAYEQIKELISVDTLKTMQLLGFNYKSAIGEPLTLILRNLILSKVKETDSLALFKQMTTPEMVDILKDEVAYKNFKQIMNIK